MLVCKQTDRLHLGLPESIVPQDNICLLCLTLDITLKNFSMEANSEACDILLSLAFLLL